MAFSYGSANVLATVEFELDFRHVFALSSHDLAQSQDDAYLGWNVDNPRQMLRYFDPNTVVGLWSATRHCSKL